MANGAGADESGPLVEARGLQRVYRLRGEEVHALRGIDLEVWPGEFVALIGRSGSGKTTLLNMLAGLDQPTDGRVFIRGREITGLAEPSVAAVRRETMGFVFQSFALLPLLTALENVELPMRILGWPRGERERRARESLEMVGLPHRAKHRPYELSGGEQQRVAIARAIGPRAPLILADEPTGELDSSTGQTIFRLFRTLVDQERVAFLVATHDRAIIRQADRVMELRDGMLAEPVKTP